MDREGASEKDREGADMLGVSTERLRLGAEGALNRVTGSGALTRGAGALKDRFGADWTGAETDGVLRVMGVGAE